MVHATSETTLDGLAPGRADSAAPFGPGKSPEIILPPSPSEEETQAAAELARVWLLATGEQVSIHGSPATSTGIRFFLADSPLTRSEASLPSNADGDSYRIVTRAATSRISN